MHPGKYLLDRHSGLLTSDVYNGEEFVTRDPRRLNSDAIVILCSQTGTTKETVRAAEHARRRGACVISLTLDPQSPLAAAADHVLQYQASYTTGIPIDGADSNYSVLYMLLAGIVDLRDKTSLLPKLLESLPALQPAIERGQQHFDETFTRYAERYGREKSCTPWLAVRFMAQPIHSPSACSWKCCGSTRKLSTPMSSSMAHSKSSIKMPASSS